MIKVVGLLIIMSLLNYNINAQTNIKKMAELNLEKTVHNFDTIIQNVPATYFFKYKNTGKANLIVKNVSVGCKCTSAKWNITPLKRNKTDVVAITYNAASKGEFTKMVTIESNGKIPFLSVIIKGYVK